MKTIGFIGCGNMGAALARAVAKTVAAENILLADKRAGLLVHEDDTGVRDTLINRISGILLILIGLLMATGLLNRVLGLLS